MNGRASENKNGDIEMRYLHWHSWRFVEDENGGILSTK